MKKRVTPSSSEALLRRFPRADLVPGWYFRIGEGSAGVYGVEGVDSYGRKVYRRGGEADYDDLISRCVQDARQIQEQLEPGKRLPPQR